SEEHMSELQSRENLVCRLLLENKPLHFLGAETAKGVKEQGGVVEHLATDVEVSCLPRYLPEFIEVDISQLELNEIIHLSELKLPEGVRFFVFGHGDHRHLHSFPTRRSSD